MFFINYDFKDNPWGGGNQFLKALKEELKSREIYSEKIDSASNIILNCNPGGIFKALKVIRKNYFRKKIIFRIDGPIYEAHGSNKFVDYLIIWIINNFSSANIFQSKYSFEKMIALGLKKDIPFKIIINAPDKTKFNTLIRTDTKKAKINLITSSWSDNQRKGFDIIQYLDDNLDFDKYNYTFIGNTAIKFKNISYLPAMQSAELGKILQENDIFLSTSKFESCSNSLIEAIHCGCVPLARNNSSHPEIVKYEEFLFKNESDVIEKLNFISLNLYKYRNKIQLQGIVEIADEYVSFINSVKIKRDNRLKCTLKLFISFFINPIYNIYYKIK